ncbi:MAG: hypothetical protein ABFR97_06675 [Thermodesulfobacteriota bacterium]
MIAISIRHLRVRKVAALLLAMALLANLTGCLPHAAIPIAPPEEQWADAPFWAPGISSTAQRFELAKRTEPELIAFLRRMPKGADLHNHVSGAAFAEFNLAAAAEKGLNYDLRANVFTKKPRRKDEIIAVDELIADPTYLAGYLDTFSMRGWHSATSNGHDHFFQTFAHFGPERSRDDMLVEIIRRNHYQQVHYLELMTHSAPEAINRNLTAALTAFDIDDLEAAYGRLAPLVNQPATSAAIKTFLDEREQYVQAQLAANTDIRLTGDEPDIVVRYISQLKRLGSLADFFVDAVVAMAAINHDQRVVALNVVAPEDHPRAMENFAAQMAILDFLWQKMGQPNITLHAGELVLRESPVEPMRDRISRSILQGRALRIGHGIAIAWEDNVGELLDYMRDHHVVVEICLSSNAAILGVTGRAHPFMLYRRAGVPLTIATDDEGISRSNLTMEYVQAVQAFDLDYHDVVTLARNSLEFSFLPGESLFLDHDYQRVRPEFAGLLEQPGWQPDDSLKPLLAANPKMERQVNFEQRRRLFENFVASGFK